MTNIHDKRGPRIGKLPNRRVFNRFFRMGEAYGDNTAFRGVNFTYKIAKKMKHSQLFGAKVKNDARYFIINYDGASKQCYFFLVIAFPTFIGFIGILGWFFILLIENETDSITAPIELLYALIAWNLLWLNFRFLFDFVFNRFQGAYIDRIKQTFSFTWDIKSARNKNQFGHSSFPFKEIEVFKSRKYFIHSYGGGIGRCTTSSRPMLTIRHVNYMGAIINVLTKGDNASQSNCYFEWEYMLRFVDNSLPLPDVPELERYRHLDDVTVKFDKEKNRPKYYWRLMHKEQQDKIEENIEEDLNNFSFDNALKIKSTSKAFKKSKKYRQKKYDQDEIEKIWEQWPIEQKYFKKINIFNKLKQRTLIVLRQLLVGW